MNPKAMSTPQYITPYSDSIMQIIHAVAARNKYKTLEDVVTPSETP